MAGLNHNRARVWILALGLIVLGELAIARNADVYKARFGGTREAIWSLREHEIASASQSPDVLFLGDSTVRAAIDARRFKEITGIAAMNLSLTGNLGTYGDFAILSRFLQHCRPPRAIVLWHTIDVWNRDLDLSLFSFTRPALEELGSQFARDYFQNGRVDRSSFRNPVKHGGEFLRSLAVRIPSYRHRMAVAEELGLRPSFRTPGTSRPARPPDRAIVARQARQLARRRFRISDDAAYWLGRLLDLAEARGITVYLARSPIHADILSHDGAREYVRSTNRALDGLLREERRLKPLNRTNLVFTHREGSGDKDHVNRAGARFLTGRYARLVAAELAAASRPANAAVHRAMPETSAEREPGAQQRR